MRLLRRLPVVICSAYILLATIYSIALPVYEPPDESYHFAFVQHLIKTGELPVQNPAIKQAWNQEGSQAPLYYMLASLVARIVPGAADPYVLAPNPHAIVGVRDARSNHNLWTRTRAETFPWRGPVLALHLVRLMGVALGAWTVYAVYRTARLAAPNIPVIAPMVMAFTGFSPMFLMQSSSINNDVMVAATGATASWLILLVLQCGFTWRRVGILAGVLALAAVSKASGLTLGLVAGVLLAILLLKGRITIQQAGGAALVFGGAFALLAAWWYVRNLQLYGDLTGLRTLSQIIGTRASSFNLNTLLGEMTLMRISTWGFYGWVNVFIGPNWLPAWMDILTVIALLGGVYWVIWLGRTRQMELILPVGLLGVHFLVVAVSIAGYSWLVPASVGRLLIPAMAALSILACLGWYSAATAIRQPRLVIVPVLTLVLMATLAPFLAIAPAYANPSVVAGLPASAVPLDVRFDKIRVLGYVIAGQPVKPGDLLPVTLYYQGEPDDRNLSLYLTAFGRNGRVVGKVDSYPGGGNLPTSTFDPAAIYADTYFLPITDEAEGPVRFKIEIGFWSFASGEQIKPTLADGTPLDLVLLRGGSLLSNQPSPQPEVVQRAVFGGALRLDGYSLVFDGKNLVVALIWEALTPAYEDFNVFVHLQTEDGKLVAQADSPPLQGDYPTSAWAAGHPFADWHSLRDIPPGEYRLVIGLYRLTDGSRLPVDAGGDSVRLQTPIILK